MATCYVEKKDMKYEIKVKDESEKYELRIAKEKMRIIN